MGTVFAWEPLVWAIRVVLLGLVCGLGYVALLYFARFLRPKLAWRLIRADLPEFRSVGATAKFLGQELTTNATLDTARDKQITALSEKLDKLRQEFAELHRAMDLLTKKGKR